MGVGKRASCGNLGTSPGILPNAAAGRGERRNPDFTDETDPADLRTFGTETIMNAHLPLGFLCLSAFMLSGTLVSHAENVSKQEKTRITFPITPEAVAAEIDKGGPRVVFEIYDDNEAWSKFLEKTASGKREWLEIALRCMDAADAHPSEELHAAFGAALKDNPEACLELAQTTKATLHSSLFATFPAYDYPTLDVPQAELKARIDAVTAVSRDDLASIKEECLADLRNELKAVRKEFGALESELPEDSPHYLRCEVEVGPSKRTPEDPLCRELLSGPKHLREANGQDSGSEILEFYRLMVFDSDDDIYTTDEELLVFERVSDIYRGPMQWKRDPATALKSVRGAEEQVPSDLSGVDVIGWNAWNCVLIKLNEAHYLLTITAPDTVEARKIVVGTSSATAR